MAWAWNTQRVGKLKGTMNDDTRTTTVDGISGNAILSTPQETAAKVNVILDIGGKAIQVNEKLIYDHSEGVVNNE